MARSLGMKFVQVPWTSGGDDSKLQRFLRVREAMQDGSIRLPEDPVLLSELASIRGKALPSGGERLEASRGHDDVAHAAVMAASIALTKPPTWADDSLFPWEKAEKQAAIDRAVARLLAY